MKHRHDNWLKFVLKISYDVILGKHHSQSLVRFSYVRHMFHSSISWITELDRISIVH